MAKLRPGDKAALLELRKRADLTIDFFERAQGLDTAARWRGIVESAFVGQSLRKMRLIVRELDAMTIGLAPHERDGLEALLQQRLGVIKEEERKEVAKQVAAILTRGTIQSERERRRLEDYAEMVEAIGDNPGEVARVRAFLSQV